GPVRLGATVSNLRGLLPDTPVDRHAAGLGTLGFLALRNGRREREVVLVSSRHVLLAHGAARGAPIYRPLFARRGDAWVIRGDALEPIAEVLDEGAEGSHPFPYPGEAPGEYFVDCASARVLVGRGVHVRAELPARGGRSPAVVRGVARVHPLDAGAWWSLRVQKVGGATGHTVGRVVDAVAAVEVAGGPPRLGTLVIRGEGGPFVGPGDSGALVLDDRDRAVGLVWGRSDAEPDVGYACHIHPVLDRLGVTLLGGGLV
ncbi:MAG TPA: hypothetical protein VFX28_24570, partial [Methylomirabilota bacterium]|nr:hypothetical protein [Methylomirabilota bacterium]